MKDIYPTLVTGVVLILSVVTFNQNPREVLYAPVLVGIISGIIAGFGYNKPHVRKTGMSVHELVSIGIAAGYMFFIMESKNPNYLLMFPMLALYFLAYLTISLLILLRKTA